MKYLLSFALVFAVFAVQSSAAPMPEPVPEPFLGSAAAAAGSYVADKILESTWAEDAIQSASDFATGTLDTAKDLFSGAAQAFSDFWG